MVGYKIPLEILWFLSNYLSLIILIEPERLDVCVFME